MAAEKAQMLPWLRSGTTALIRTAPVDIELEKFIMVPDGQGGKTKTADGKRAIQTFFIAEPYHSGWRDQSTIVEGTYTLSEAMLVGEWNAVIGLNDEFTYRGLRWYVESLMFDNDYEKRARIMQLEAQP